MRLRPIAFALLVVACTTVVTVPAHGQPAEAVQAFEAGNAHYEQGDYASAITAYERALEAGYASGPLYHNMGNAYYRIDQIGRAVLAYERARALIPDQPELLHNLEMARARTTDRFSPRPLPVWVNAWRAVVRAVGAWGFFAIGLALYLTATALAGYRIWTGTQNAWYRRAFAATLLAGLLVLTAAFAASSAPHFNRTAVVLADTVSLYTAPGVDAEVARDLHEGTVLDVVRDAGSWFEVRLPNGTRGWLSSDAVATV